MDLIAIASIMFAFAGPLLAVHFWRKSYLLEEARDFWASEALDRAQDVEWIAGRLLKHTQAGGWDSASDEQIIKTYRMLDATGKITGSDAIREARRIHELRATE